MEDLITSGPSLQDFLQTTLFSLDGYALKVYNLLVLAAFLGGSFLLRMLIKRIIYRSGVLEEPKKFTINKLAGYAVAVVVLVISLRILGFNISVLLAGSAALLVGLGFGLQNLFNDFISGIILLLDRTLKIGDVIEVNSNIYKVLEINFRTTTVMGRDENFIILPNSELTSNRVVNWTHSKISSRFRVDIGVDYSTDVAALNAVLLEVAQSHKKVLKNPPPFVRFEQYGDSSIQFSLYFFTNDVFRVEQIKSDIRYQVFEKIHEKGIQIPFPQRVVHLKQS